MTIPFLTFIVGLALGYYLGDRPNHATFHEPKDSKISFTVAPSEKGEVQFLEPVSAKEKWEQSKTLKDLL